MLTEQQLVIIGGSEGIGLTPHIGGRATRGWDEARQMCAANIGAFLRGAPLVSPVPMDLRDS